MAGKFELRNAKFYPYGKYKINQGNDENQGDNDLTGSVMQTASARLDFDISLEYIKPEGALTKVTYLGGVNWRFELPTPAPELPKLFREGGYLFIDHFGGWWKYQGRIIFIDENVIELEVGDSSGNGRGEGYFKGELLFRTSDWISAIEIKYNITPTDSATYSNNLDGGNQIYSSSQVVNPNADLTLFPQTGSVKNWIVSEYTPRIHAETKQNDYQVGSAYDDRLVRQPFFIKGLPIVFPYWREDLADNYNNDTIPENYQGDKTFNFIAEVKAWLTEDKEGEPIVFNIEVAGDVGYYGEDGNGGVTGLTSSSVSYTNITQGRPVESFDLKNSCSAVINLNRDSGIFENTDLISLYLGKKADLSEYYQSPEPYSDTYLFSGITANANGITNNSDKLGRGELSNLNATISGGGQILTVTAQSLPSASTTARLSEGDEYVLSLSVYSPTTGELTQKLIDNTNYSEFTDEENLIQLLKGRGFDPDADFDEPISEGYSDLSCWIEDGIIIGFEFKQTPTTFGEIEKAEFKLLGSRVDAQNGTTNFNNPEDFVIIQSFDVPFSEIAKTPDGIQLFDDLNYQPFNLDNNDPFKWVKVKSVESGVDVLQYFSTGLKLNWQYWNELKNVPNVFFNQSDAFNGFNQRASNYSEKPESATAGDKFDIKGALFLTCKNRENDKSTDYVFQFPLIVYDYGEDEHTRTGDFADFTGSITTEKLDGTDLSGSVLSTEPTKIKIHFVNNGRVSGNQDFYFITRIEEAEQTAFDIWEISNLKVPEQNSPLIPLNGEVALLTYPDGAGGWFTECMTDPTKIKDGTSYKLSGRMGLNEDGSGLGFGFSLGFTDGFDS